MLKNLKDIKTNLIGVFLLAFSWVKSELLLSTSAKLFGFEIYPLYFVIVLGVLFFLSPDSIIAAINRGARGLFKPKNKV